VIDEKRILTEDDRFIAVKKLAGELVVADRWGKETNILLHAVGDYLRAKGHSKDSSGRDLYPVHRLDRDTSGIVLFAKDGDSHRELSRMFEERLMRKTYWAFTAGMPEWDNCTCEIPLSRAEGKKGRGRALIDLKNGKPAATDFKVKERFGDIAWVEASPRTGRLHQIRLHLKALGTPILFDQQYWDENWKSRFIHGLHLSRMPLHARELSFKHPFTGSELKIECSMDDELRGLLNKLKAASEAGFPAEFSEQS
jgi:RluA family pseudouridine synthase